MTDEHFAKGCPKLSTGEGIGQTLYGQAHIAPALNAITLQFELLPVEEGCDYGDREPTEAEWAEIADRLVDAHYDEIREDLSRLIDATVAGLDKVWASGHPIVVVLTPRVDSNALSALEDILQFHFREHGSSGAVLTLVRAAAEQLAFHRESPTEGGLPPVCEYPYSYGVSRISTM